MNKKMDIARMKEKVMDEGRWYPPRHGWYE